MYILVLLTLFFFFFFNDTATTEIYTLSLHDALPTSPSVLAPSPTSVGGWRGQRSRDRKSTRLNSSHVSISYAVFCLKKKKKNTTTLATHQPKKENKHPQKHNNLI